MASTINREKLRELTTTMGRATIDELAEAVLGSDGILEEGYTDNVLLKAVKQDIRTEMQVKDEHGKPLYRSIIEPNGERTYKQVAMFDADDYKQQAAYHMDRAQHHLDEATRNRDECWEKFGESIQLQMDLEALTTA